MISFAGIINYSINACANIKKSVLNRTSSTHNTKYGALNHFAFDFHIKIRYNFIKYYTATKNIQTEVAI